MNFDVRHNTFWDVNLGKKPNIDRDAINEHGNPVFSVYQMDIIYYGYDLATYFASEFDFELPDNFQLLDVPNRAINFWSRWTS